MRAPLDSRITRPLFHNTSDAFSCEAHGTREISISYLNCLPISVCGNSRMPASKTRFLTSTISCCTPSESSHIGTGNCHPLVDFVIASDGEQDLGKVSPEMAHVVRGVLAKSTRL
jgi:hypothetical protein